MSLLEKERIGEPKSLLIEAGMVLSKIRMLGYKQDLEVLSGFF